MSMISLTLPRNVAAHLLACLPNRIDRDRSDSEWNREQAAEHAKRGEAESVAICSACAFEFATDAEAYRALLSVVQDAMSKEGGTK